MTAPNDLLGLIDPSSPLAQKLISSSRNSALGTFLVAAVGYGAAKYGLGFDQTTDELVAGALIFLGGLVGHMNIKWHLTTKPIFVGPVSGTLQSPPAPDVLATPTGLRATSLSDDVRPTPAPTQGDQK